MKPNDFCDKLVDHLTARDFDARSTWDYGEPRHREVEIKVTEDFWGENEDRDFYGVVTFYDEGEHYGLARATISLNGQTYQFALDTENYDSVCFEKLVAKLHDFLPESERQKQINQESWALLTRRIMAEETLLRRLQEAKLYADAMIGK